MNLEWEHSSQPAVSIRLTKLPASSRNLLLLEGEFDHRPIVRDNELHQLACVRLLLEPRQRPPAKIRVSGLVLGFMEIRRAFVNGMMRDARYVQGAAHFARVSPSVVDSLRAANDARTRIDVAVHDPPVPQGAT